MAAPATPSPGAVPGAPLPFRAAVRLVGWLVVVAACAVLVGWTLDVEHLKSVSPGAVGMKALTAVGLVCAGGSLLLRVAGSGPGSAGRRAAAAGLAAVPGLLGALVLAQFGLGRDLGIDELLFVDDAGRALGVPHPGRVPLTTAVCFLLTTAALLLFERQPRRGWRLAELAMVPVAVIAGMAILGYAYSVPAFYGPAAAGEMAVNAAGCFVALAAAIVLARPRGRLPRLATTNGPVGSMLRRLGPFVVLVPLALGWMRLRSIQWGILEPEAAAWWLSGATMVGFAGMVAWCASVLSRADDERRRLEAATEDARDHALEMSRVKSDFVANMSHELRTPLNGVIGTTELLLGTTLDSEQREYGEAIRTSGDALMAVIGDILDFSKMEAGRLELDEAPLALEEHVRATCALMGGQAGAKGLDLSVRLGDALPAAVVGDAVRLRQILLNLMSNAVKFTADGGVTVAVSARPQADGRVLVAFAVTDTGIGVPPGSLATLFDSFTQADSSTTRRYGGTGLGLAISKQLVELMGGRIRADSVVGEGSRFWFEVPLAPVAGPVAAPTPAVAPPSVPGTADDPAPPAEAPFAATVSVLVAEDNEINQLVIRRMLEKLGYHVEIARDGREAVDLHASGRHALVLMDCQLPELDGYDATREIRRRERGGPRIPIVAMTAHALQGDRDKCLGVGMDDYLSKPLRYETLQATLARALAAPAGTRELAPQA